LYGKSLIFEFGGNTPRFDNECNGAHIVSGYGFHDKGFVFVRLQRNLGSCAVEREIEFSVAGNTLVAYIVQVWIHKVNKHALINNFRFNKIGVGFFHRSAMRSAILIWIPGRDDNDDTGSKSVERQKVRIFDGGVEHRFKKPRPN
jgi:hypothetical protein